MASNYNHSTFGRRHTNLFDLRGDIAPGPGSYYPERPTRYSVSRPGFSFGSRHSKFSDSSPGPAAYHPSVDRAGNQELARQRTARSAYRRNAENAHSDNHYERRDYNGDVSKVSTNNSTRVGTAARQPTAKYRSLPATESEVAEYYDDLYRARMKPVHPAATGGNWQYAPVVDRSPYRYDDAYARRRHYVTDDYASQYWSYPDEYRGAYGHAPGNYYVATAPQPSIRPSWTNNKQPIAPIGSETVTTRQTNDRHRGASYSVAY